MSAPKSARATLDKAASEDGLLGALTDWATLRGWSWHHVRRSDKALQMGTPGFPDVVFARKGVVILAELKSQTGQLDPDQFRWSLDVGDGYRLWRPVDEDRAIEELR